jgi:hypothetical protein
MTRRCMVSMWGKGDQVHLFETDVTSVFAAANAAIRDWATFWWYSSDAVIDVRAGNECWRVRAARVSAWYAEQFRKGQGRGHATAG